MKQSRKAREGGLYPDLFARALREHQRLPLRAGRQERFLDLFADNRQLDLLLNPNWQVIYGRRGTGKTTLLGALQETVLNNFAVERNLCVLINVYDCLLSPVGEEVSAKVRALAYFQAFIENLSAKLMDFYLKKNHKPGLSGWLNGLSSRKSTIEDGLLNVAILAQTGRPVGAYSRYAHTLTGVDRDELEHGLRGGLRAGLAPASIGLSGSLGSHAAHRRARSQAEEHRVESPAVPRFDLVRKELVSLLDLMDVGTLYILIDEWPALDKSCLTEIQPRFAELLKRTFGGSRRFCVKIASSRHNARFSNRGNGHSYIGLEMNADVFEGTNLDHVFMEEIELDRFYQQMLFTRLTYCVDELKVFRAKGSERGAMIPDQQFVLSIFADDDGFRELVKGAGGIPRDFLELFNQLAHRHGYSVERLWRVGTVRGCVREVSVASKEYEIEYKSDADRVRVRIMDVIGRTRSRVILIRRDDLVAHDAIVDELFEKRILHQFPSSRVPGFLRPRFAAFLIDYGQFLDWTKAFGWDDASEERSQLHDIQAEHEAAPLVVDLASLGEMQLNCPHCGSNFPKDVPSYAVKRLCPFCFEPQGNARAKVDRAA